MGRNGFTLSEALISIVIGMIVLALAVNFLMVETRAITTEEIRQDIAWNARNVHKLMSRDLLQAGLNVVDLDSVDVVSIAGDTLIIQLSETESVRYFVDNGFILRRNEVQISDGIRVFVPKENVNGLVSVKITFAADRPHPWMNNGQLLRKNFVWVFAPRNLYYH